MLEKTDLSFNTRDLFIDFKERSNLTFFKICKQRAKPLPHSNPFISAPLIKGESRKPLP